MSKRAFVGASVFDGRSLQAGKALLLEDGHYQGCVAPQLIPHDFKVETMEGGTLMPGFVDLQVNGGGGVMFNDETSVDGLRIIAQAHAATGTRTLLPTLITDTPEKSLKAVDAVEAAIAEGVPGIVDIHLEGPYLSIERKGAPLRAGMMAPKEIAEHGEVDYDLCAKTLQRMDESGEIGKDEHGRYHLKVDPLASNLSNLSICLNASLIWANGRNGQ